MKNKHFFLISCESIFLFCIVITYVLDVDKKQILEKQLYGLKFNKETTSTHCQEDTIYSTPKNYTISLFSNLSYSFETIVSADSTVKMQNNPPKVKIIAPENNSLFDWNSLINYTIKVSDFEDGESDLLEIASNEVFLEVVYLPDASMAIEYVDKKTKSNFDSPGFSLLKVSDCFNCHAVKTRLQGPAFLEIAKRYPHNASTVKMLAERVIQGSSGVWGIPAMSSHPDLTKEQSGQIIEWILENAEDPNRSYYSGIKGTFQTKAKPEKETGGVYILTASYTDHGLKEIGQLNQSGLHTIVLRSK